jgi:hypothetical protein
MGSHSRDILVVHTALGGVTISSYINKEVMLHSPRNTNTVVQLSSAVNFLSDRPTVGHKSLFCGLGGGGGVIKESKSRSNQTSREKWRESDEVADKIRLLGGLLNVREQ